MQVLHESEEGPGSPEVGVTVAVNYCWVLGTNLCALQEPCVLLTTMTSHLLLGNISKTTFYRSDVFFSLLA